MNNNMILSSRQRYYGMQLREDEDFITLVNRGVAVCKWYAPRVTVKEILDAADNCTVINELEDTKVITIEREPNPNLLTRAEQHQARALDFALGAIFGRN